MAPRLSLDTQTDKSDFDQVTGYLDTIRSLSQQIAADHAKLEKLDNSGPEKASNLNNSTSGLPAGGPSMPTSPVPGHQSKRSSVNLGRDDMNPLSASQGSAAQPQATGKDQNMKSYEMLESEFIERRRGAEAIMNKVCSLQFMV